ncbi:MAG TPA: hypothetical protein VMU15_02845 [Anaeromyxobacter sp.]|nr:hypothetical protein [Anaeromyxobacter sp.]
MRPTLSALTLATLALLAVDRGGARAADTCASAAAGDFLGSCTLTVPNVMTYCFEEWGGKNSPAAQAPGTCTRGGGTWSPTKHCPTDKVICKCQSTGGDFKVIMFYQKKGLCDSCSGPCKSVVP